MAAGVAVVIMAAAGLAAGLLGGSTGGHATVTVPVSVKSAFSALSGDVYVEYRGRKQANAEVYGTIKKAANGEVAQLYSQQFPYKQAPAQVGSVILHPAGTTASYQFR